MSGQLPAICWMFNLDGHSLFVGPVEVVKYGPKQCAIRANAGRFSGFRVKVPTSELFESRAGAVKAAADAVKAATASLRSKADRLDAMLRSATETAGEFDGWSFRQ